MGKRSMTISVIILDVALAYQKAVRLIHVPETFLSQILSIGVHSNIVATMLPIAYKRT